MDFFTQDFIRYLLLLLGVIILCTRQVQNNIGIFGASLAALDFFISNNLWESVWKCFTQLASCLTVKAQMCYIKANFGQIPVVVFGAIVIFAVFIYKHMYNEKAVGKSKLSKYNKKVFGKTILSKLIPTKKWFVCPDKLPNQDSKNVGKYACEYYVCPVRDSGRICQQNHRVASFRNISLQYISPIVLAKHGFHYDTDSSSIQCFRCFCKLTESEAVNSDPHSWHSSECDFMSNECETYNQSFKENQDEIVNARLRRNRQWQQQPAQESHENMNGQLQPATDHQDINNPSTISRDGNSDVLTPTNHSIDPTQACQLLGVKPKQPKKKK